MCADCIEAQLSGLVFTRIWCQACSSSVAGLCTGIAIAHPLHPLKVEEIIGAVTVCVAFERAFSLAAPARRIDLPA
jgi:hypothetical protein